MGNGYNAGKYKILIDRLIGPWEKERLGKLPAWAKSVIETLLNETLKADDRAEKAELALRVERLRDTIRFHAYMYYNLDRNLISDHQYDTLYNNLKKLERDHPELVTPDSPTQLVDVAVAAPLSETNRLMEVK